MRKSDSHAGALAMLGSETRRLKIERAGAEIVEKAAAGAGGAQHLRDGRRRTSAGWRSPARDRNRSLTPTLSIDARRASRGGSS